MDAGTWRLRCRKCGSVFELALEEGDFILEAVKTVPCPGCHSAPCGRPQSAGVHWHDILDFIVTKAR